MGRRMMKRTVTVSGAILFALFFAASTNLFAARIAIFNVKDYGATGIKTDNAQAAIQKAIDACGKAGGGMVYLPPGEYTSGTLHLRSHVRFHIEGGATLYASKDMSLFAGQAIDLQNRSTLCRSCGRRHPGRARHRGWPGRLRMEDRRPGRSLCALGERT